MGAPSSASDSVQQVQTQQMAAMAMGVKCPRCGAVNNADDRFCASCGAPLHGEVCPHCGSDIDADADFCEVCHRYIRSTVCSFCGANMAEGEAYCPECGSPRGGIVCPTCHTLNDFAFCKQCGQALTPEARALQKELLKLPEYKEMIALSHEYNELNMQLPYETERDRVRDLACQQLRERVLTLLAQDEGVEEPDIPQLGQPRMSKDELEAQKLRKLEQLTEMLERLAAPPSLKPATVRNYAMAQKPMGVRLAWRCNYKQALHSSPCGCAKPQLGGKWVVLGHNTKQEIKDDK